MNDEPKRMVVCVPRDRLDTPDTYPGSTVRWCAICGAEVWAAQSTLRLLADHPDTVVCCNDCALGLTATEEDVHVLPVAPDEVRHNPHYRAKLEEWRRKLGHTP